jgi:hypothetical protein
MMTLQRINVLLLVVLGVLLIGLCLPLVHKVRLVDARTKATNNLKQVTLVAASYHDVYKCLPPAFDRGSKHEVISYPHSIHVRLLPYLDEKGLFDSYVKGKGDTDAVVSAFVNPMDGSSSDHRGVQSFAANLRVFSRKGQITPSSKDMPALAKIEPGAGLTMAGIIRGSSNTIFFAPKLARCAEGGSRYAADPTSPFAAFFGQHVARTTAHYSNPQSTYQWAPRGDECRCSPLMAQAYQPAPILVGTGDGTVRAFPGNTEPGIWNAFLHPTD